MSQGRLKELQDLNEKIAKRANQRLVELEKHNMKNTSAYQNAQYYIGEVSERSTGDRFSRKKTDDIDALADDLKQASRFLRSETSTVSGEKQRRNDKIFESLTKKGGALEIPSDIKVPKDFKGTKTEYFQKKFLQFLDENVWKDIKKYIYASDTNVLQEAGEAIARGSEVKDLNEAYKDYLKGEIDIFTMWNDWTKVD